MHTMEQYLSSEAMDLWAESHRTAEAQDVFGSLSADVPVFAKVIYGMHKVRFYDERNALVLTLATPTYEALVRFVRKHEIKG